MPGSPTPNIGLTQGTVGGDTGVWGGNPGINGNNSVIDSIIGAVTTISLNNSNVVLNAAQFQSGTITFNSTLTGSVTITFPTSFIKGYTIQHLCTGSSAFTITMQTTAAGGQSICASPGEALDILNDGTNLKFRNLGRVGTYWEYGGSSVPAWVSGCTVPPYINCDGTTFSSATYPQLAVILAGTTLPDARGRVRATLNQGTGRLTGSISLDGNTNLTGGGDQNVQAHTHGVTDPAHLHTVPISSGSIAGSGVGGFQTAMVPGGSINTSSAVTNITIQNSTGGGQSANVQPTYIGGLTLIRAG